MSRVLVMKYQRTVERAFARNENKFLTIPELAKETGLSTRKIEYLIRDYPDDFVVGNFGNETKYRLKEITIEKKKRIVGENKFLRELCYDYILLNSGCTLHNVSVFVGMSPRHISKILYADHRIIKKGTSFFVEQ